MECDRHTMECQAFYSNDLPVGREAPLWVASLYPPRNIY